MNPSEPRCSRRRARSGSSQAGSTTIEGYVRLGHRRFLCDDDATERAITGDALDKASEAALQHTGGGTVTDTEVEDEESYYEVEVTREDGSQLDVHLDEDFNVVGSEEENGEDD